MSCPYGASGSSPSASRDWKSAHVRVDPGLFPPELVVQVKAWACELPATHELPLSRWSTSDLVREVCQSGLVASISGSTLWRWLHQDAIRPWQHRSWLFPRDPNFAFKAGRILDLYHHHWDGKLLKDDEFVISPAENTSIQPTARNPSTQPCRSPRPDVFSIPPSATSLRRYVSTLSPSLPPAPSAMQSPPQYTSQPLKNRHPPPLPPPLPIPT